MERPEDWEWSSARWHAGIHPTPIEMDRTLLADLDGKALIKVNRLGPPRLGHAPFEESGCATQPHTSRYA